MRYRLPFALAAVKGQARSRHTVEEFIDETSDELKFVRRWHVRRRVLHMGKVVSHSQADSESLPLPLRHNLFAIRLVSRPGNNEVRGSSRETRFSRLQVFCFRYNAERFFPH
jgi:hypothetical protein